jgi:hypothetical protein
MRAFSDAPSGIRPDGAEAREAEDAAMTSPTVIEVPLVLQPISEDTFTHAAIRAGDPRPVTTPQTPIRRSAV